MTKTKSTKHALIMSVMALFLCFTMLLGTTFAWFTDSVTSAGNKIMSGTLKVDLELLDKDSGTWNSIKEDKTALFNNDKWEPGYTEVKMLKVENEGTLALKWKAKFVSDEELGILADVIDVYVLPYGVLDDATNVVSYPDNRDLEGYIKVGTVRDFVNTIETTTTGKLEAGQAAYLGIALKMQESAGNDYQGEDLGAFDIAILATQDSYESDSFDNQYDKDADYVTYDYQVGTLEELKDAFAKGGNVLLTDDIEFEKITTIEPGADVYLNLNGKTITVDEDTTSNTLIWVKEGAKLTVDGNGTIDLGSVSTMAIFCPYGELVIENGTFIRDKVTTVTNATTGLFMGAKITASNVTINGGYFDPGYYDENAADIEAILAGTKEFTETADDIAKRGNSKDANPVRVAVKDNVSVILNHSGYGSFKVYGGTFVGANPAWGDEGCMLPTIPNYLRPWSYYQGALLDGQTFNENGIVIPEGYTITMGTTADGVPTYTVEYNK